MEEADATTIEYPAESFDVIYSRDTILHIKDKLSLYKNFLKWLKPGGRLMVSDYNCTPDTFNDEFKVSLLSNFFDYSKLLEKKGNFSKAYVAQRGYNLHTVLEYGNIVQEAGFRFVSAVDETDFMVKMLQEELDKLANMKDEFIKVN